MAFCIRTALAVTLLAFPSSAAHAVVIYNQSFTGAELDNQVTVGNATYPAADITTVTGTQLDLSPVAGASAGVLFRMPILAAGDLTGFEDLVVTVTMDWLQVTADNDFGVALSDGTQAIGGMQYDGGVNITLDFADGGTELGYSVGSVLGISYSTPQESEIIVGDLGGNSTVQITNNLGDSITNPANPAFSVGPSPLDYTNSIDFLLVGNNGGEIYGVRSVSILAEATIIPEPTTALLLGAGLVGLAARRRRLH